MSLEREISVIIPSFNDLKLAAKTCELLNPDFKYECIVIESGSLEAVDSEAFRVESAVKKGRAYQLNQGAQLAKGEVLCFLHADTQIERKALDAAAALLLKNSDKYWGGTFKFKLASTNFLARVVEIGVCIREKLLGVAFGDQCICVLADKFFELGEFDEVPIMEDWLFIRTLQKKNKYIKFTDYALTSARRWEEKGYLNTCFRHFMILLKFNLGVSLENLSKKKR